MTDYLLLLLHFPIALLTSNANMGVPHTPGYPKAQLTLKDAQQR
jgi:hypothetical protein